MVIYWTSEGKIGDLFATLLNRYSFSTDYILIFIYLLLIQETLIEECDKKLILLLD